MSLPTTEGAKNSYPLVRSVVTSSDNPPKLEESSADVTPLCVQCRTKGFVNLAGAKILTDKFILRIDEYSLKVFPVAFAMYNAFYWMDCLWKYIGTCFSEMISKIIEFETINKLETVRASDRSTSTPWRFSLLPLQCAILFIGWSSSEMILWLGSFTLLVKIMHMADIKALELKTEETHL